LEPISCDEFFENFEEGKLKFLYQERTADGNKSRFSKLISRDQEYLLALYIKLPGLL
jgi:hypothetical protein